MSSTQVLAEVLGIGFQGLLVMYGLYRLAAGPSSLDIVDILKAGLGPSSAFLLVASTYILGVFIDRLGDLLFRPLEKRLQRTTQLPKDPSVLRYYIYYRSSDIRGVIDYIRSRIRLGRATCLTSIVMPVLHTVFILMYQSPPDSFWMNNASTIWAFGAYFIFATLGLFVFWESQKKFFSRLKLNFYLLSNLEHEANIFECKNLRQ